MGLSDGTNRCTGLIPRPSAIQGKQNLTKYVRLAGSARIEAIGENEKAPLSQGPSRMGLYLVEVGSVGVPDEADRRTRDRGELAVIADGLQVATDADI